MAVPCIGWMHKLYCYRPAVLNLWAAAHWWALTSAWWDATMVGMDNFFCESRFTIREKVSSLSSGVTASATYLNDL